MKSRFKTAFAGGALFLVVSTLPLTSGSASAETIKKEISITLQVNTDNPDKPVLVVSAQDVDNCDNHEFMGKKGCFKIGTKEIGLIEFKFEASDQWSFEQFTICPVKDLKDPKITTSCAGNLSVLQRLEFFVTDDKQGTKVLTTSKKGVVNLLDLEQDNLKKFYLLDQNNTEQVYFYNIQACRTDDPAICATLDPPVENTGRN